MTHAEINKMIGANIKKARTIAGMLQEDIGKVLGVSCQQIQKYESGKDGVSSAKLYFISQATSQPISFFFEEQAGLDNTKSRYNLAILRHFEAVNPEVREKLLGLVRVIVQESSDGNNGK